MKSSARAGAGGLADCTCDLHLEGKSELSGRQLAMCAELTSAARSRMGPFHSRRIRGTATESLDERNPAFPKSVRKFMTA